jgi:flagellar biosynthesis chaperone FliJ
MPDNGFNRSQIAKAESTLQDLEIKLQHTKALLAERKAERLRIETQVQTIKSTGDINKMIALQSHAIALDKTIVELVSSESECANRIESARRYLYTLYVKLEKLRQEAATLSERYSPFGQTAKPEEQAALARLRLQIQAITGAE